MSWVVDNERAPEDPGALFAPGTAPMLRVRLWPHRSLTRSGFVWFISVTAALISLPLLELLGSAALWGMLPFLLGTVALLWYLLARNYADRALGEELRLWADRIELTHENPNGTEQNWSANPYWVHSHLYPRVNSVENYLTLKGGGREVEIGAFLSPRERQTLHDKLRDALSEIRQQSARP